jgi:hypothetical protein
MKILASLRDRWGVPLVTLFIVMVLSLQAFAGFGKIHSMYYPFMDYPMYSPAHFKGEPVHVQWRIYGIGADGSEVRILPEDLHMGYFQFEGAAIILMRKLSRVENRMQDVREFARANNLNFVKLRIEDETYAITDKGLEKLPNKVMAEIGMESSGEER